MAVQGVPYTLPHSGTAFQPSTPRQRGACVTIHESIWTRHYHPESTLYIRSFIITLIIQIALCVLHRESVLRHLCTHSRKKWRTSQGPHHSQPHAQRVPYWGFSMAQVMRITCSKMLGKKIPSLTYRVEFYGLHNNSSVWLSKVRFAFWGNGYNPGWIPDKWDFFDFPSPSPYLESGT